MGAHSHLYLEPKWKKLRQRFLHYNRSCRFCGKPSEIVDHIKPHRGDMRLFWKYSNLQALCKKCHDSIKQIVERNESKIQIGLDGYPVANGPWSSIAGPVERTVDVKEVEDEIARHAERLPQVVAPTERNIEWVPRPAGRYKRKP